MAIGIKEIAGKAITIGVEGTLIAAKRIGQLCRGASRIYNMVADVVPVPLPRVGGQDNGGYEPPSYP